MYKQMQSLDQDGSLTKSSYLVFGKDNHAVASATSKKQALKLQKSDQKIKKASNGLTYSAGKNSIDFNVKTQEASMDHIFSAKDLKFHQGSGNEVKGKYGMSWYDDEDEDKWLSCYSCQVIQKAQRVDVVLFLLLRIDFL